MRTPLRAFYEGLLESQWWPAEKLQALQRRQLTSLLNHARATSPFYRYRLNVAFRPNGSIDWDKWTKIPIVTRADLSANFDSMLSRQPVKTHGPFKDLTTSGSTGEPVTIRTTGWMTDMVAACNWRSHTWHGIDWSGTMLNRVAVDVPQLEAGDLTGPWGPPWDRRAARGKTIFLPRQTTFRDLYRRILQHRPDYVAGGAMSVSQLVELSQEEDELLKVACFLTRGGAVSDQTKQAAKRCFGADVVELYSSKEAGPIAHPCPDHLDTMHVNEESVLLEVADERGAPCASGQLGRVIVTPFASTALPLIRYDQGDLAVAGERCSCGRGLKSLARIAGRTFDVFRHPDGRVISALIHLGKLRSLIHAQRWQIAQVGPTSYEVRLPAGIAYKEDGFAEFIARAQLAIFGDSEIVIRRDYDLRIDGLEKFKETVNEWNPKRTL